MSVNLSLVVAVATLSALSLGAGAVAQERAATTASTPDRADPLDLNAVAEQIRKARPEPADAGQPLPAPRPDGTVAQNQTPPASGGAPDAATQDKKPEPDLSALRYFAQRGDTVRLNAEIARLRSLYPDWTPPKDPLAIEPGNDQQLDAMWKLYSEGKLAELRRAIADRQAAEAGWKPPADLLERLAVAETRRRLVNASDLEQYDTVIRLAAVTPSLLNCADVDVLWRVAAAFAKSDRMPRAVDAYGYVLKNCTDPQQRVATIQKAAADLTYQDMQTLLALEKPAEGGAHEFDGVRDDLARRFVADATASPDLTIAPAYLQRLRSTAQSQNLASDSLLLGWYYLRRKDMTEAESWFRASRASEDSASASQGLALTLIARNASAEAEEVMLRWRAETEDATATYLAATANMIAGDPPPAMAETVLQRVASFVVEKRYVPTAQQLGWYARAFNQPQTAAQWFRTALQWKPDDEPSAYGLAITLQQLDDKAGVSAIQTAWAGRSARIANLGLASLPDNRRDAVQRPSASGGQTQTQAANQPQTRPQPRTVVSTARAAPARPSGRRFSCNGSSSVAGLTPAQALATGWCMMNLNRPLEAAKAFEAALAGNDTRTREDAAYGQSLAYLRLGLTNKAAVAAAKAPQGSNRTSELQTAILANRAVSAFDTKHYRQAIVYLDQRAMLAAEPADLMVLRGYALMNLGMLGDAKRLFEAVAETGNRDAMRAVVEIRERLKQPQ
ncbi:cellulose synthase [Rhizobium halophytocola]|uniref:Tetratricopeptide (TPR) repeat protein n=1 Tax=Rhizobium halophytocola TaxID=735519 RepID=A0ABS4DV19_9HYPH|nr:cellulose synthase [Rhizobium halophytocola]MBP1849543.1 tetratricopeptide (TPR) repeat protein [Rhizobium halophytocola]